MTHNPETGAARFGGRFWVLVLLAFLGVWVFFGRGAAERVTWGRDLQAARVAASAAGQLVLVDFSADWCGACRHMKRHVFSDELVAEVIERDFQAVRIDMSHPDADQEALAMQYGVAALPTYLILDPDGQARAAAAVLRKSEFLRWLDAHGPATDGKVGP